MNPGRNDPCPCGSGEKYKKCCGQDSAEAPVAKPPAAAPRVDASHLFELFNAGRYADAESAARELVEQNPDFGLVWKVLGAALRIQGKDALQAMQRAAALMPGDPEAHNNLGDALRGVGRLDDAAASCRRALQIKPDFAEAHSNLGSALLQLGQLEEAVSSYRRAVKFKPHYAAAWNNLGSALLQLGQLDEAVISYRRALQIEPRYATAHSNLGNALQQLGQFEEALASCRQALQIQPDLAEAHNNLGNTLRDLKQLDEAVASCRRALQLKPEYADAYSNLGNALQDLGQYDEAVASYRRALQIKPDFPEAHVGLGCTLLNLKQLDAALASFQQALQIRPDYAEAHCNLGLALAQLNRPVEAEASFRRALEINPNLVAAFVALADLRIDQGQFSEAEELVKRAQSLDPQSLEAWCSIPRLRKMTERDAPWLVQAQRLISERRLPPHREAYLRKAIGKYFDDVKDFEQAFTHFRRASELRKLFSPPHDRRLHMQTVDRIIQTHDRAWLSQAATHADTSARPVFIVGMMRSGTSLAEQILASHPAVFGAGELRFWGSAMTTHLSAAPNGEPDADIIGNLARDYLQLLQDLSPDALRVVDKMPTNFYNLGLINAALPNARIIHMQRNPLDTCLSIYFQDFSVPHPYTNDLQDLASVYTQYRRLMEHWRLTLPREAILDVPYEELVDDQEAWSRKMLAFIDLPWDPRCLDFDQTDRRVLTASRWQVRQKINKSSVARWRNYEQFVGPLLHLMA